MISFPGYLYIISINIVPLYIYWSSHNTKMSGVYFVLKFSFLGNFFSEGKSL